MASPRMCRLLQCLNSEVVCKLEQNLQLQQLCWRGVTPSVHTSVLALAFTTAPREDVPAAEGGCGPGGGHSSRATASELS